MLSKPTKLFEMIMKLFDMMGIRHAKGSASLKDTKNLYWAADLHNVYATLYLHAPPCYRVPVSCGHQWPMTSTGQLVTVCL